MSLSKLIITSIISATLLLSLQSCKSSGSDLNFDWDTDLTPNPEPEDVTPPKQDQITSGDSCKDSSKPCFTLLINIPTQTLIADQGMALLSLASESSLLASNLKKSCKKAFQNYVGNYKGDRLHPVSMKIALKLEEIGIENSRCTFNFFSDEEKSDGDQTAAGKFNEGDIGISVRLTKFKLENTTLDANAGLLNFLKTDTKVSAEFRDIYIYGKSGKQALKNSAGNLELDLISGSKKMDSQISFAIDYEKLKANISKIDVTKINSENVKSFFEKSKSAIATLSGDGLALLSFGIKTAKNICADGACSVDRTTEDSALEIALDSPIPTEAYEQFRLSSIRMMEVLLRTPVEKGYGLQFKSQWSL